MSKQTLSVMQCVRCTPRLRRKFQQAARKFGDPSDVLRDLMQAFADGRVSVKPDPNKPTLENPNGH